MSNSDELLKSLCRLTGVDDWRGVLEDRHLVVDGRVIALVDETRPGLADALAVHVELGALAPARAGDVAELLLRANAHRPAELAGWFGLQPESSCAVYTFIVTGVAQMDAQTLSDLLREQVGSCSAAFDALNNP